MRKAAHFDYVDYTDNDNQRSAIFFLHKINNIGRILLHVDYIDHDDDDNQYWTILFLHKINNLYSTYIFPASIIVSIYYSAIERSWM